MKKIHLALMSCVLLHITHGVQATANNTHAPQAKVDNQHNDNKSYYSIQDALPDLSPAFISTTPTPRHDGLKTGSLPSNPAFNRVVTQLGNEIAKAQHARYDSFLISHQDTLVFESYYLKGRVNLPHGQASATKAYTTLAIGRAIQLGYLTMADLHKPVHQFFKSLETKDFVSGFENVTLDHTLSMRSGIQIDDATRKKLGEAPEKLVGTGLLKAYFSNSKPITNATQVYNYQSIDPRITMLVLDAVVPQGAKSFIKRELIDKLGIKHYAWADNISGVPEGAHSAMMTSRDMLKWGRLIKDKGVWQGKQLVPIAFIDSATNKKAIPHSDTYDFSSFDYGYYIWQTDMSAGGKTYRCNLAWGGGGQYVITFDGLDVVIAVTARSRGLEDKTLELVEQRILPHLI